MFVALALPHAHDGTGATMPEATDEARGIGIGPGLPTGQPAMLSRREPSDWTFCCVLARSRTHGFGLGYDVLNTEHNHRPDTAFKALRPLLVVEGGDSGEGEESVPTRGVAAGTGAPDLAAVPRA